MISKLRATSALDAVVRRVLPALLAGCGAATPLPPVSEAPRADEACTIAPRGTWAATGRLVAGDGVVYFAAPGSGLYRLGDGAPERLAAWQAPMPADGERPFRVAWEEGVWLALDETGRLLRGPLGGAPSPAPLGSTECRWIEADGDRLGSIHPLPGGGWLLGCGPELVVPDAGGAELRRFSRTPFTSAHGAREVGGRVLAFVLHPHHGVAVFDTATGRRVWQSELRRTTGALHLGPHPLALVTYRAYAGARSGLYALDVATGALAWELPYPPPWPGEGVDPRSAMQLVPRWIDAQHLSLESTQVVDGHLQRVVQRLALRTDGAPPEPDGPVLPLDDVYGSALLLPDGSSFGVHEGRWVERDPDGALRSEILVSEDGAARRFADGRVLCPAESCPWRRPCEP